MKVWKKSLLMILALLTLLVGTAFAYASTLLNSTTKTLKASYTKTGDNKDIKATEPLTVLLMGVDTGDASRGGATSWEGNSDSMIALTLNPKTNTSTMVSMERDTMTNIINSSGEVAGQEKLNAAYPYGYNDDGITGAAKWAMNTVQMQAGIPIHNFVAINMDGLVNLVNDVGGIDVNNTSGGDIYISDTEPEYTAVVKPGKQHINGEQALVYARDRHHLPNGDYGRAAHQREVITQLMKKMLNMNNLSQYQKFLDDVSKDIKTNIEISPKNLASLVSYKDCFKKIVSIQYQGVGEMVDGASYQFTSNNTYLAVQNAMLASLGKSPITTLDSNLVTLESYYQGTSASSDLLPSATVTEGGKSKVYGIQTDGKFVKIDSKNSGQFISTDGSAITSSNGETESSSSTEASSSNTATTDASSDATDATTTVQDPNATVDPNTGATIDPNTGTTVDPNTGAVIQQ